MSDTALQTAQETIQMLTKRIAELEALIRDAIDTEQFPCEWDQRALEIVGPAQSPQEQSK